MIYLEKLAILPYSFRFYNFGYKMLKQTDVTHSFVLHDGGVRSMPSAALELWELTVHTSNALKDPWWQVGRGGGAQELAGYMDRG